MASDRDLCSRAARASMAANSSRASRIATTCEDSDGGGGSYDPGDRGRAHLRRRRFCGAPDLVRLHGRTARDRPPRTAGAGNRQRHGEWAAQRRRRARPRRTGSRGRRDPRIRRVAASRPGRGGAESGRHPVRRKLVLRPAGHGVGARLPAQLRRSSGALSDRRGLRHPAVGAAASGGFSARD